MFYTVKSRFLYLLFELLSDRYFRTIVSGQIVLKIDNNP
jgi:hypothetical protein